jgi:DUF4097 and DUF4098 domain-containing protein YvlB
MGTNVVTRISSAASSEAMRRTHVAAPSRRLGAILLAGLAIFAASPASGEDSVTRVDRYNPTLARGTTVTVENISGDVEASPGSAFSATITLTAKGSTKARAQDLLKRARILETTDEADYTLTTRWPREVRRSVTARYALTIPKGLDVVLETVQGDVRVRGLDGEVRVQSVNGSVEVEGARKSVSAKTVNGTVSVAAAAVPEGAEHLLSTVNGNVTLTLPDKAAFELTASILSGSIVSTFDLPRSTEATWVSQDGEMPEHRTKAIVKVEVDDMGDETEIEIVDLERALGQVRERDREVVREMRRFTILEPGLAYRGRVGRGGARVSMNALNGRIAILSTGSQVAQAKEVLSPRRSVVVTIPQIPHMTIRPRGQGKPVIEVLPPLGTGSKGRGRSGVVVQGFEGIARGDIQGDFLSTSGGGSYRLGHVSGTVKVLTQWGEIRVGSAGGAAELKTNGGDVVIGEVGGTLAIKTLAGSIESGRVGGSATVDTAGGDIRLGPVGGSAYARTLGGDVFLEAVRGGVDVETLGGDVRVRCVEARPRPVAIRSHGGDVELVLPSEFRADVELIVDAADADERRIRSDFPELAVTRRGTTQRAVGTLNGGGPKVTVRTATGSIRLKKE